MMAAPRNNLTMSYTGPSMKPTLQPGDVLTVEPDCPDLRLGDIVVFRDSTGQAIVHRLVALEQAGLRTRGDNNSETDAGALDRERLIGRVTAIGRGRRTIPVKDGFLSGRIYTVALLALKRSECFLVRRLHHLYHGMARFLWPKKMFGALLQPKFLYFSKPEGPEIQMLLGRTIIGRYRQAQHGWQIRRPYRLLLDEARLPRLPKTRD